MKNNKQTVELLKYMIALCPITLIETFYRAGRLDREDVHDICLNLTSMAYLYNPLRLKLCIDIAFDKETDLDSDIKGCKEDIMKFLMRAESAEEVRS